MFNWDDQVSNGLAKDFAAKAKELIANLALKDIIMVPYFGMRTIEQQAKLWRQSRSTAMVQAKIDELKKDGCSYLANVIKGVGKCNGPDVTKAIPGYSWHNWGQALDCYWQVDGKPNWDGEGDGYKTYAYEAVRLGLTAGYNFKSIKDPGHIQLNGCEIPTLYGIKEVNDLMKQKFGD